VKGGARKKLVVLRDSPLVVGKGTRQHAKDQSEMRSTPRLLSHLRFQHKRRAQHKTWDGTDNDLKKGTQINSVHR